MSKHAKRLGTLVALAASFAAASCGTTRGPSAAHSQAAPFRPLAGTYGSSWGTPITFQQQGNRAVASFDHNGWLDCLWDHVGVYLCSWRNDRAQGRARIWWQGNQPAGQYGVGASADNGGPIAFWYPQAPNNPPSATGATAGGATASVPDPSGGSSGCSSVVTPPPDGPRPCASNGNCPDDMRCLNARCTPSAGTKCGVSSDCSHISNEFECKTSGPHKMDGVCTPR